MNNIQLELDFCQDSPLLKKFYSCLPPRPYCTEFLGALKIRPKSIAARDAYIQPNPITRAYWIVMDIDSPQSRYWPDEWHVPAPNIEARNPANNHQHLFYMIDPAVYTLRQARQKPLELAADVDKGLTELLGADPGYGKLISKNPLSNKWEVYVWHDRAWGLTELLDYIPDKIKARKPRPKEAIGLGRNCAVFEESRHYSYSEWRRQKFSDPARLLDAVYDFSMNINAGFTVPMMDQEVKCIARSVSRWTSRHMSAEGLREWGAGRRERSIEVRQTKSQAKAEMAKKLYSTGKTQKQISIILGMNQSQISRLLRL